MREGGVRLWGAKVNREDQRIVFVTAIHCTPKSDCLGRFENPYKRSVLLFQFFE
jgi:hypothetical protein